MRTGPQRNRVTLNPLLTEFRPSVIRGMTLRAERIPGVINLSQGFPDPDFEIPEFVKAAAVDAIGSHYNQYSPPIGDLDLRKAVATHASEHLQLDPDPESEVVITCGATEAMYDAVQTATKPGDVVVIPSPSYENYGAVCKLLRLKPRYVPLDPPDWRIDLDQLRQAWTRKPFPSAILLCNPNNPTGTVYTRGELEAIAQLCKDYNSIAITDEVYEHIIFDDNKHISIASLDGMWERSITISSASKTFSVTGWRIGMVIASSALAARIHSVGVNRKQHQPKQEPRLQNLALAPSISQIHDFITICAPTPLQRAVARAFEFSRSSDYFTKFKADYQSRRDFLFGALHQAGFIVSKPQGGYYLMVDVASVAKNDTQAAESLLAEAGVASVPASCFFLDESPIGERYIRLCFCKSDALLQTGAQRLVEWQATRSNGPEQE